MRPIARHSFAFVANDRAPLARAPLTGLTELDLAAAWTWLATRRDAGGCVRRVTVLRPFTLPAG
jgi:hypothetical protein